MRLASISTAHAGLILAGVLLFSQTTKAPADPAISPEFSIGVDELSRMTAALPKDIRRGILANASGFLQLTATVLDQPKELFVLVDKNHPLPPAYVPSDLVNLKDYPVRTTWPHLLLRRAMMPEVLAMVRAAHADRVTLTFSSAYRSYSYQQGVFEREVQMYGREMAERESAQAGYSQHQLGTAVDFGSISDDDAPWRVGGSLLAPGSTDSASHTRRATNRSPAIVTKAGTTVTSREPVRSCRDAISATSSSTFSSF